jgi:hypothetical protein
MILNGTGDDLGRRSGAAIDQHNQRIFLATITMGCDIALLRR